jgi:hypothetical protein
MQVMLLKLLQNISKEEEGGNLHLLLLAGKTQKE